MLQNGRGKLFNFGDTRALSNSIIELIENDALRNRMRKKTYELGRNMIWKEVAKQYCSVFERVLGKYTISGERKILQNNL
jgi:glycosyltransferase involved in cell wall biosynthesis